MKTECDNNLLLEAFTVALEAVDPVRVSRDAVSRWDNGNPVALATIGKAACGMYEGAYEALGDRLQHALVVTAEEYAREVPGKPEFLFGSHPVPNSGSLAAGARLVEFIAAQRLPCRILVMISGGSSAIVEYLNPGVSFEDLQRVNQWLLSSGFDILQMNVVRKCLSAIKGGGLLDFLPHTDAQVMLISDVPGDDPGSIGSGLMVDDPQLAGKLAQLNLPEWILSLISAVKASHARPQIQYQLIASNKMALDAAEVILKQHGFPVHRHEILHGDATRRGADIAQFLLQAPHGIHLWGGETTVVLPAQAGRGGRNQHLALSLAQQIAASSSQIRVLVATTDGVDGASSDAGAIVDNQTIEVGNQAGLDASDFLERADSNRYFDEIGALVHTGATGTNVMDIIIACKARP